MNRNRVAEDIDSTIGSIRAILLSHVQSKGAAILYSTLSTPIASSFLKFSSNLKILKKALYLFSFLFFVCRPLVYNRGQRREPRNFHCNISLLCRSCSPRENVRALHSLLLFVSKVSYKGPVKCVVMPLS